MEKRFSIITPIFVGEDYEKERRLRLFPKCIESVKNQTYDKEKFEHIIVNDGSTVSLTIPNYPWIKIVDQKNSNRIIALNTGLKEAKGEIICLLDSDDEYEPNYLETISLYFEKNPSFKIFNFGCTFQHKDGAETKRDAFKPKKKRKGHEVFGGGQIVNGTFVFHRSVYDDLGAFPPSHIENIDCSEIGYSKGPRELFMTSPYDFSAYAQMEYPEIRPYFQVVHPDHPKGLVRELGNPWGNDFYLFYKYTRKYHSKPMDDYLYRVNLR